MITYSEPYTQPHLLVRRKNGWETWVDFYHDGQRYRPARIFIAQDEKPTLEQLNAEADKIKSVIETQLNEQQLEPEQDVFTGPEIVAWLKSQKLIDDEIQDWPTARERIKNLYTDEEVVDWLVENEVIPPIEEKTMGKAMAELKKAKTTGKVLGKI